MEDEIALLDSAVRATTRVLRNIKPDQYGLPTPCPDWDVRTVMNHLVAGALYFTAPATGAKPDFAVWSQDHLGDGDPADRYAKVAGDAVAAWRAAGDLDRRANLPGGGTGPRYFDMLLLEEYLHGWDLAVATGQERTGAAAVAQTLYDRWHGKVPDVARDGRAFGPEAPCPPDAPVGDRLAAYLGHRAD